MRKAISILTIAVLLSGLTAQAQTHQRGARQGDLTFGVTAGYNSSVMISAEPGDQTSYSVSPLSTNWNDKSLTVGVEMGWFFLDLWCLNFGGGFSMTQAPGYPPVTGTFDENSEPGDGSIPSYEGVAAKTAMQYNVYLGVDRYFDIGVEGLYPYLGIKGGFAYGFEAASVDDETWTGKSVSEAYNIRGALTFGSDYFITQAFFVGASIDVFAYTYNFTVIKPQEGLAGLAANSHNFSALAAPTIKIGFVF